MADLGIMMFPRGEITDLGLGVVTISNYLIIIRTFISHVDNRYSCFGVGGILGLPQCPGEPNSLSLK